MEIVKFGKYYCSSKLDKKPIPWIVIDENELGKLLLSQYALIFKTYDTNRKSTWESTTLYSWLNNEFLHDAFDPVEISKISSSDKIILLTQIQKISLLSSEMITAYNLDQDILCCMASRFAFSRFEDIGLREQNSPVAWWLKRDCITDGITDYVEFSGAIRNYPVNEDKIAVRPLIFQYSSSN